MKKHVEKVCDTPWRRKIATTTISIADPNSVPFMRTVPAQHNCPPGTWRYLLGDVVIVKNCLAVITETDGTCVELTVGGLSTDYRWQRGQGLMCGDAYTGWYDLGFGAGYNPTSLELFSDTVKSQLLTGAHLAQRMHRATVVASRLIACCRGPELEAVEALLGLSASHLYDTPPSNEVK